VAFAATLGISPAEALRDYHTSISAIYIETSRQEVRLPAGVQLPPLGAEAAERFTLASVRDVEGAPETPEVSGVSPRSNGNAPPPTVIPAGLRGADHQPGTPCPTYGGHSV
jgi:hypothetical protein